MNEPPSFEEELRAGLREIGEDIPDHTGFPPEFWDRLRRQKRRPGWLFDHRVYAAAVCVVLVALVGATVLLIRPDRTSTPIAPRPTPTSASPSPTSDSLMCAPGPLVHPTSSPAPDGGRTTFQLPPDPQPAPWIPSDAVPLDSRVFHQIRHLGGCIQAWAIDDTFVVPKGATALPDDSLDARTWTNSDGLTEVYLRHDGLTYLAASGNLTPTDLATFLHAAVARS